MSFIEIFSIDNQLVTNMFKSSRPDKHKLNLGILPGFCIYAHGKLLFPMRKDAYYKTIGSIENYSVVAQKFGWSNKTKSIQSNLRTKAQHL